MSKFKMRGKDLFLPQPFLTRLCHLKRQLGKGTEMATVKWASFYSSKVGKGKPGFSHHALAKGMPCLYVLLLPPVGIKHGFPSE